MPADSSSDHFANVTAPRRRPRSARPARDSDAGDHQLADDDERQRQPRIGSEPSDTGGADGQIDGLPDEQQQAEQQEPPADAARRVDVDLVDPVASRDYHRLHAIRDFFSAHARPDGRAVDPRRRGSQRPCSADVDTASRKETEAWRAKHEADYRRDYVPLAGLFALKRGANTAGSAASNNIVLPKSAPAVIGRFVLDRPERQVRATGRRAASP